ncbi:MAG TPA: photosynthetic reaction center cytochrome c subunit family protein [Gemmatimonadaceae bacterium]|nr:photosynthetic reaction center cytochrome c subunit family protein [Gemmatimonadaceae bacterium]
MRSSRLELVLISAALFAGCTPHPSSEPSPVGKGPAATTGGQAPAPGQQPTGGPEVARGPGGPGGRRPPNPMAQDTVRRKLVDSILVAIAGHEKEPAGTVFKNVKLLKDMPAGDFVRSMDTIYGRGLGMTCANCHVIGQFDGDTRKNKRVAREMQTMENYINSQQLPNIKELDEDYTKVSCVTCHLGSGKPKNTMAVPMPSTAPLPPLSR